MKDTQKNSLLTELTADESATINGGCHHYRSYRPIYYPRHHRYRYRPVISRVTNIKVVIDD